MEAIFRYVPRNRQPAADRRQAGRFIRENVGGFCMKRTWEMTSKVEVIGEAKGRRCRKDRLENRIVVEMLEPGA